jgi:hypothetical protein
MNRKTASRLTARTSRTFLASSLLSLAYLALAGCGGAGSGPMASSPSATSPSPQAQACSGCGTAVVSITDQPGDFVSYIVKVDSLTLTRSDGSTVQTVPVSTQIDFTQLVNLSEIISADQVPAGRYTSAALTLDYSGATIVVSTASGNVTVPAADILDGSTGQPVSAPITVKLLLGDSDQLVVTPGAVANLALDFNLLASNAVNLAANPITVTVNPVLTASLAPDATRQIHVRGALASVDAGAGDYVVNVRPFEDAEDTTGQVTVQTTGSTTFSINGTSYTGAAGITELATLPTGTLTSAYGSWNRTAGTFTAVTVSAGSSVVGPGSNTVEGTVTARSGDTITLGNNLMFSAEADDLSFERQVIVTVGPNTSVTEDGQPGAFTIADISVGQRVRFFGTPASPSPGTADEASPGAQTFDATSGSAALESTTGIGLVTGSGMGTLTLDLLTLGGTPASGLDFTGTGVSAQQDATASSYQVTLPPSLIAPANGAAVGIAGFVTPFGSAPPDFAASTLTSFSANAELEVSWASPGATTPFATLTGSELLISQATLQGSSEDHIEMGPVLIDPSTLSGGLQLLPDTTTGSDQSFAIAHVMSDSIDTFGTFNDMATALATDLNGTTGVLRVFAVGSYESGQLTVDRMIVELDN